jgi:hypothetical protein
MFARMERRRPTVNENNRQAHVDNNQHGVYGRVDLRKVSPDDLETGLNSVVDDLNEALESLERAKVVGHEALEFEVSV